MVSEALFDPKTLRKLESLALMATKVRAGRRKGERRSTKRGTSLEFADYRNYARGDDLRRVDWNIYARLERPFVKLFEEEEDLSIHFILDSSGSMNWPREGDSVFKSFGEQKFTWARRVLGGLAYIALLSADPVSITALNPERSYTWGPSRGQPHILPMLKMLSELNASGHINLNQRLGDYALRSRRPGLCFVISDLMDESGYQDGLKALQSRGFEVTLIHVLSPDEVNPVISGDLRLIDVETNDPQEVSIDESMMKLYLERLQNWRDDIGAFCLRRGIHFISLDTSTPWEELILYQLRKLGVIR